RSRTGRSSPTRRYGAPDPTTRWGRARTTRLLLVVDDVGHAPGGMVLARLGPALGAGLAVRQSEDAGDGAAGTALQRAGFLESSMSTLFHRASSHVSSVRAEVYRRSDLVTVLGGAPLEASRHIS